MYLEALRKPIIKLAKVEFLYPDGSVWFTLDNNYHNKRNASFLQDGTLNVNLNNGIRRTANITLANENDEFDYDINKLWFNQQVRLSMGLLLPDGTEYYIPQGVFYIKDPEKTFLPNQRFMRLQLVDKWSHLDGSLFGYLDGIHEIPLNTNILLAMQSVLHMGRGNGGVIDNTPPLFTNYYDDKKVKLLNDMSLSDGTVIAAGSYIPVLNTPYTIRNDSQSGTLADIMLELNTALTGLIGYNANGQLQLDPSQDDVNDQNKPILWNFNTNEAEFLGSSHYVSNSEIYNDIVVTGATTLGKIAKARIINTDIRSPYNVQTIGLKTKPRQDTTSDQYVTDEQCADLGRYWLKKDTIHKMSATISCSQMFHLYENGIVTLQRTNNYDDHEKHLITSYTLPIGLGAMSINATCVNNLLNI